MSTGSEIVGRWLATARADLLAARNCLQGPHFLPGVAAYHCQQAAEKLVKALLIHRGIPPARSHDIDALARGLSPDDRAQYGLGSLGGLTPYAIAFRYPGEDSEPALPDAAEIGGWIADIEAKLAEIERELNGPA